MALYREKETTSGKPFKWYHISRTPSRTGSSEFPQYLLMIPIRDLIFVLLSLEEPLETSKLLRS